MDYDVEIEKLKEERDELEKFYIPRKLQVRDYHAIADCAMDLREIDAKIRVYEALKTHAPCTAC